MNTPQFTLLAAMAIRACGRACLLLGLTAATTVDPELDLLELDDCAVGGDGCDALSLRQLRGEAVQPADHLSEGIRSSIRLGFDTWTIVAEASKSDWAWDVVRVKFLTLAGEEVTPDTPGCNILESGHADVSGYEPENVFSDSTVWWGGRKDASAGKFYLGLACSSDRKVAAVQLEQKAGTHSVTYVQVYHNHEVIVASKLLSSGWLQTIWTGSFGLRLLAKTVSQGWAWDVRRLKVLLSAPGGELKPDGSQPVVCHTVDSGYHVDDDDVDSYAAAKAFEDNDSLWGGRHNSANELYIGIACEHPFGWPDAHNVYLYQLSGHWASEMEVQQLTAFGWKTKDTVYAGPGELMPLDTIG